MITFPNVPTLYVNPGLRIKFIIFAITGDSSPLISRPIINQSLFMWIGLALTHTISSQPPSSWSNRYSQPPIRAISRPTPVKSTKRLSVSTPPWLNSQTTLLNSRTVTWVLSSQYLILPPSMPQTQQHSQTQNKSIAYDAHPAAAESTLQREHHQSSPW